MIVRKNRMNQILIKCGCVCVCVCVCVWGGGGGQSDCFWELLRKDRRFRSRCFPLNLAVHYNLFEQHESVLKSGAGSEGGGGGHAPLGPLFLLDYHPNY